MPRPREYDETEVLNSAMRIFWEHGYRASTRQLAEAMGINQFSVYASFKSKAGLFGRALEQYIDQIEASLLVPLLSEKAAMPELRQFLEGFVHTKDLDYPNGCLICNTMIDKSSHTKPIRLAIERYRALITRAFLRVITNAYPDMPEPVIRARCEFLFGALLGLFVQKRMGAEGQPVQILVDEIMSAVERPYA